MINHIRLLWSDSGIVERLMYLMWFCKDPLTVFPVFSLLGYLPDVDFRIEVCSKRFPMVSGVAINYVKIMQLIEMMFGSIGCKD